MVQEREKIRKARERERGGLKQPENKRKSSLAEKEGAKEIENRYSTEGGGIAKSDATMVLPIADGDVKRKESKLYKTKTQRKK